MLNFGGVFFIFTPNLGEDEPILTIVICFKGVGSTTNQNKDFHGCTLFYRQGMGVEPST